MNLSNLIDLGTSFPNISLDFVLLSTVIEKKSRFDLMDISLQVIYTFEFESISITYGANDFFYLKSNDGCYYEFDPYKKNIVEYITPTETPYLIDRNNNLWAFSNLKNFDKNNTKDSPSLKHIYIDGKLISKIFEYGSIKFINDSFLMIVTSLSSDPSASTLNNFSFFEIVSKSVLWHFNLEDHLYKLNSIHPFDYPHKVGKPLGIYKDQLWFEMDNYGLMCLHKETGELIHYLRDLPYATGETYRGMTRVVGGYAVIPYTNEAILLKDEGKIICFAIFYYWELDLETMQMSYHYLKDYFKEVECYTFGSRFKPLEVDGDLIYMVDTQHKKIGIFNRKTLRYEHIELLPEGSGAPRSIEKQGDRLYIDTFGKKILVYQI
jgi:hypothetical protein